MGHSSIFQISTDCYETPICEENFRPSLYEHFADYVQDHDVMEMEEEFNFFDRRFDGIFKREGQKLTFLGCDEFIEMWTKAIKESARDFDFKSANECRFMLQRILEKTHLTSYVRVFSHETEYCESFGDFMERLYQCYKPGDTFYLITSLDFHH